MKDEALLKHNQKKYGEKIIKDLLLILSIEQEKSFIDIKKVTEHKYNNDFGTIYLNEKKLLILERLKENILDFENHVKNMQIELNVNSKIQDYLKMAVKDVYQAVKALIERIGDSDKTHNDLFLDIVNSVRRINNIISNIRLLLENFQEKINQENFSRILESYNDLINQFIVSQSNSDKKKEEIKKKSSLNINDKLSRLPKGLEIKIAEYLDEKSLIMLSRVSKKFHELKQSNLYQKINQLKDNSKIDNLCFLLLPEKTQELLISKKAHKNGQFIQLIWLINYLQSNTRITHRLIVLYPLISERIVKEAFDEIFAITEEFIASWSNQITAAEFRSKIKLRIDKHSSLAVLPARILANRQALELLVTALAGMNAEMLFLNLNRHFLNASFNKNISPHALSIALGFEELAELLEGDNIDKEAFYAAMEKRKEEKIIQWIQSGKITDIDLIEEYFKDNWLSQPAFFALVHNCQELFITLVNLPNFSLTIGKTLDKKYEELIQVKLMQSNLIGAKDLILKAVTPKLPSELIAKMHYVNITVMRIFQLKKNEKLFQRLVNIYYSPSPLHDPKIFKHFEQAYQGCAIDLDELARKIQIKKSDGELVLTALLCSGASDFKLEAVDRIIGHHNPLKIISPYVTSLVLGYKDLSTLLEEDFIDTEALLFAIVNKQYDLIECWVNLSKIDFFNKKLKGLFANDKFIASLTDKSLPDFFLKYIEDSVKKMPGYISQDDQQIREILNSFSKEIQNLLRLKLADKDLPFLKLLRTNKNPKITKMLIKLYDPFYKYFYPYYLVECENIVNKQRISRQRLHLGDFFSKNLKIDAELEREFYFLILLAYGMNEKVRVAISQSILFGANLELSIHAAAVRLGYEKLSVLLEGDKVDNDAFDLALSNKQEELIIRWLDENKFNINDRSNFGRFQHQPIFLSLAYDCLNVFNRLISDEKLIIKFPQNDFFMEDKDFPKIFKKYQEQYNLILAKIIDDSLLLSLMINSNQAKYDLKFVKNILLLKNLKISYYLLACYNSGLLSQADLDLMHHVYFKNYCIFQTSSKLLLPLNNLLYNGAVDAQKIRNWWENKYVLAFILGFEVQYFQGKINKGFFSIIPNQISPRALVMALGHDDLLPFVEKHPIEVDALYAAIDAGKKELAIEWMFEKNLFLIKNISIRNYLLECYNSGLLMWNDIKLMSKVHNTYLIELKLPLPLSSFHGDIWNTKSWWQNKYVLAFILGFEVQYFQYQINTTYFSINPNQISPRALIIAHGHNDLLPFVENHPIEVDALYAAIEARQESLAITWINENKIAIDDLDILHCLFLAMYSEQTIIFDALIEKASGNLSFDGVPRQSAKFLSVENINEKKWLSKICLKIDDAASLNKLFKLLQSKIDQQKSSAKTLLIKGGDLKHVKFNNVKSFPVDYVEFEECDFSGAKFKVENIGPAKMTSCTFINASFANAEIQCEFKECDFSNADFSEAKFNNGTFFNFINNNNFICANFYKAEFHFSTNTRSIDVMDKIKSLLNQDCNLYFATFIDIDCLEIKKYARAAFLRKVLQLNDTESLYHLFIQLRDAERCPLRYSKSIMMGSCYEDTKEYKESIFNLAEKLLHYVVDLEQPQLDSILKELERLDKISINGIFKNLHNAFCNSKNGLIHTVADSTTSEVKEMNSISKNI